MYFNSLDFLIFFPVVIGLYYVIPQKIRYLWLLAASYYFYMCWNAKYALLMFVSTFITYLSGLAIEKVKNTEWDNGKKTKYKKLTVFISVFLNLGILFYFKYSNFTMDLLSQIFSGLNIELKVPEFDIILPVGISFYTFQALSYTFDVYRDDIYAEKNFFRYALFVSFFPQLVAGPIERSKNLLKQLAVPKKFSYENAREGLLLMIWGYFLKIVLCDRMAIFVDTVYADYTKYNGLFIAVATILFGMQIYCDFYGYSTIAMGAAKFIGIDLMENFDAPYLATSVSEFWRRWHISLTSWFKDYLYIPLGGSKKGKVRKYLNKMIVFLTSGLWHGANLTFVIWGGLNGSYQVIGEILLPLRKKFVSFFNLNTESIGYKLLKGLVTFNLINFSWIFFRAQSFTEAINIISAMFEYYNPWIFLDGSLYKCGLDNKNFSLMIICLFVLLSADIMKKYGIKIRKKIIEQDYWCRCLVMISAICFILIFGVWGSGYDATGFIYFQF